jgi:hypothetical protein
MEPIERIPVNEAKIVIMGSQCANMVRTACQDDKTESGQIMRCGSWGPGTSNVNKEFLQKALIYTFRILFDVCEKRKGLWGDNK